MIILYDYYFIIHRVSLSTLPWARDWDRDRILGNFFAMPTAAVVFVRRRWTRSR